MKMKIIKLTSDVDDRAIYVNVKHVVFFWEQEDGTTQISLSNGTRLNYVKETPDEILHLIEYN